MRSVSEDLVFINMNEMVKPTSRVKVQSKGLRAFAQYPFDCKARPGTATNHIHQPIFP
jgi:hypothetical protein